MRRGRRPKYPLEEVQALVAAGEYYLSDRARQDAETLEFDEDDILDCVATLSVRHHFSHTVEAIDRPGLHQDVYRRRYEGFALYIKLQLHGPEWAVIISFHRDGQV